MFGEPVNLSPWLRKLRLMLPLHTDATPDERPLERADVAIIARHVPDLSIRHFNLLARLDRFVIPNHNYELASMPQRALFSTLNAIDYAVLSLPLLETLGGTAVLYGHPPG